MLTRTGTVLCSTDQEKNTFECRLCLDQPFIAKESEEEPAFSADVKIYLLSSSVLPSANTAMMAASLPSNIVFPVPVWQVEA